ncbi:hypothetical protein FRC12_010787 [Ceratobasidium sp. 428]|nr:hypothetical protein FRC12_010787 [Ceratobasidium sp. 428]
MPAPDSILDAWDVLGGQAAKQVEQPTEETDPSREPPARTLTWFVTEVLRRSRTSISVLQVALAYLAGAKRIPQHIRDELPGMDWLGSEFTPSPLIDPRRTFLASLVLASKFLLDKAFSNKASAKLSGLEALEVGKCERALGTALNWRLWVGREATRESVAPVQTHNYPSPAHSHVSMFPPSMFPRPRDNSILSSSSSPISTIFTQGSTPSLMSEISSDADALQGYDEVSAWTQTPKLVGEPEETVLYGSPFGHPSAAMGGPMRVASKSVVQTRPVLPPFWSFNRPVLRRGPSDMVTPQTDSNLGWMHMMPVRYDGSNEDQLAYTDFARLWEAVTNQAHWNFKHGGVVGV